MSMDEIRKHAQLGIVSRHELLEKHKYDPEALKRRIRSRSLVKVQRGVYRIRDAPDSFETRAFALTKYAQEGSAISHFAAAHLHGLDGFKEPSIIDLLVPIDVQVHPKGAKVHRTREPFQIYKLKGLIPITSLARTLVDLSEHLDPKQLEKALNAAWRIKRTIGPWLRKYLASLPRKDWKGRTVLARMVERLGVRGMDSGLEVDVLHMIEEAGLPTPARQFIVRDKQNNYVIRGDVGWVDECVILHIDSRFHATEEAMARDAKQRSTLTDLEWTQIFVTRRTIKDRLWIEQIKRALAKAANRPRRTAP